jgi:hypothetical protein
MLISVVINTRDNVKKLKSTINSYFDKADLSLNNFEIIVKVDFDDINTLNYISTVNSEYVKFIVSSRKQGYSSLHEHVNDMVDLAKGNYILAIGDDSPILTNNWNLILINYLTQFKVYFLNYQELYEDGIIVELENKPTGMRHFEANSWNNVGVHPCDFIFPIFPKNLKQIWGTISPHALVDNWLGDTIKRASYEPYNLDLYRFINEIKIQLEISPKENSPNVFHDYLAYVDHPFTFKCIDALNIYLHGTEI